MLVLKLHKLYPLSNSKDLLCMGFIFTLDKVSRDNKAYWIDYFVTVGR